MKRPKKSKSKSAGKSPVIHFYPCSQTEWLGQLVDLTDPAKELGIKESVVVTEEFWNRYITPSHVARAHGESEDGRIQNILQMYRDAAGDRTDYDIVFEVSLVMAAGRKERVVFKASRHVGASGKREAKITPA